jgi:hypothetical protein
MRSLTAILAVTVLLLASGVRPARAEGRARAAAASTRLSKLQVGTLRIGLLGTSELREVLVAEAADPAGTPSKPVAKPAKKAKEASCEVIEFHASKAGNKAIDEKLGKWKKELDQPPLSAFDTFKVTGAKSVTIAQGGTSSVQITANLGLLFKGVVTENDKDRLQLEVTVDNAKGKRLYRSNTTQDSGASQILSAGKSGEANVFFVVTCSAQ